MKVRKFFVFAVVGMMIFAGTAHALDLASLIDDIKEAVVNDNRAPVAEVVSVSPENALSTRPDDSVYCVLRLDDTGRFLRWLLSRENINIFMPLIVGSKSSNEILGVVEIISAVVENTPLKSAALIIGINRSDAKTRSPFVQIAFSVDSSISPVVQKIAGGSADAKDIAKLLLGGNNPLTSLAETMIKVDKDGDIFRVNNDVFMKAQDSLILVGTSAREVRAAVSALKDDSVRLFSKVARTFDTGDFVFVHCDYETLAELDDDDDQIEEALKYFDKPLNVEFAFRRFADKFLVSTRVNVLEAFKKRYSENIAAENHKVPGGYIDMKNAGGKTSPIAALGMLIDFSELKKHATFKALWGRAAKELEKRFGITDDELTGALNGAFSLVVNDRVNIEGFNVPALYLSHTGKEGAAAKIFEKLAKSRFYSQVQDGILQMDSSLSPVSCLAALKGDTLCIDFADLSSLAETPELKPALAKLMNTESLFAFWLDFAGLQSWLVDGENGVLTTLAPLASLMGYGKIFNAVRDALNAELSVPSMSIWSETAEIFHTEFAVADVDADKGLFAKLVRLYIDLKDEIKKLQTK